MREGSVGIHGGVTGVAGKFYLLACGFIVDLEDGYKQWFAGI